MTASATVARILIVEDDEAIRSALEVALRGEDYDVRAESDGTAIHEVARQFRPDLAILDVRLPVGPDGYTMARQLRDIAHCPVMFLTAADSLEDRRSGFSAGADDYVIKPFSLEEVLWRTKALLRRTGLRRMGDLVMDERRLQVERAGKQVALTRLEYQLLRTLAMNVGEVVSRDRLLEEVWPYDVSESNVLEVHMSSLRRKLELHGPRIIHTMRGMGYVLNA